MKITKSQLKQIIKEELEEVMDDREVLVRGFGKLKLSQIERRLVEMLEEAGRDAQQDPPDFYNLRTGMIQAFYEAYRQHKDVDSLDEAEDGDFDPEAAINQPGADPSEKEIEAEKEEVRLARLKDDITKLLKDPDASDIQTAKDKLGGYGSKKES